MAEIRSAIIQTDRTTYTDAPLIWSELSSTEQGLYVGGQYSTLSAWEAAKEGDLVSLNQQHTAVIFATGTSPLKTALTIDGYTTDVDNFLKITSYEPHRPVLGLKSYVGVTLSPAVNYVIDNNENYTQIEYLNISNKDATGYISSSIEFNHYAVYYGHIKYCNFFNDSSQTLYRYIGNSHLHGEISYNCFLDPTTAGSYGCIELAGIDYSGDNGGIVSHNTFNVGTLTGVSVTIGNTTADLTLENNIILGSTGCTCYDITITDGTLIADHNVSSDLTAPGTNTVQSFNSSTLFPNAATGDFRPAISYVSALGVAWGAGAIPWERDALVDTSGSGDYSTLAAAESGEQTTGNDLALRNERLIITCAASTGGADTTNVVLDGITTSPPNNLTVKGDGWDGDYLLSAPSGYALEVFTANTTIKNMRVDLPLNAYNYAIKVGTTAEALVIDGVWVDGQGNTQTGTIGISTSGTPTIASIVRNCVVLNGCERGYSLYGSSDDSSECSNCVASGAISGFYSGYYDTVFKNCIAIGCSTEDFSSTPSTLSDYNISSDATAPGSNSLTNQVATDLFTDPANGDFTLKAGSNAIDAGLDLSDQFTTDITGAERTVPWDMGAFLYAVAATAKPKIFGLSSYTSVCGVTSPTKICGVS